MSLDRARESAGPRPKGLNGLLALDELASAKHYAARWAMDRQVDYAYEAWSNLIQRTEDLTEPRLRHPRSSGKAR